MSQPKPPFHDLEFSGDMPLWTTEDTSTRRAFLMPASVPSEFLAFGVLGPSKQVHFVARGTVETHLGAFLTRLRRGGAEVGLYVLPPLPRRLLREYLSNPPWEGHEYEEPPQPPVQGLTSAVGEATLARTALPWSGEEGVPRRALLMPLSDAANFLVFGLAGPEERVCFALKGTLQEHLPGLLTRLVQDGARVELHAHAPLPGDLLRRYISTLPDEQPGHGRPRP